MNFSRITGRYRTKQIISVFSNWIKPGEKILDIGCGTGIVAKILGDYFSTNITGCDIKNYLIYKIPFIKIKNNRIPVKKDDFDVALLNDVLHHVDKENQANIILEASRVAKKVLIFEFEPKIIGKVADIILNKLHYGDLNVPLSLRSINNWQQLFRDLGFKYKTVKLKKSFWYPFSHIAFMVTKKSQLPKVQ